MCKILKNFFKKEKPMFDSIANQMTKQDEGGEAGRELDITEARQALKNLAIILANE